MTIRLIIFIILSVNCHIYEDPRWNIEENSQKSCGLHEQFYKIAYKDETVYLTRREKYRKYVDFINKYLPWLVKFIYWIYAHNIFKNKDIYLKKEEDFKESQENIAREEEEVRRVMLRDNEILNFDFECYFKYSCQIIVLFIEQQKQILSLEYEKLLEEELLSLNRNIERLIFSEKQPINVVKTEFVVSIRWMDFFKFIQFLQAIGRTDKNIPCCIELVQPRQEATVCTQKMLFLQSLFATKGNVSINFIHTVVPAPQGERPVGVFFKPMFDFCQQVIKVRLSIIEQEMNKNRKIQEMTKRYNLLHCKKNILFEFRNIVDCIFNIFQKKDVEKIKSFFVVLQRNLSIVVSQVNQERLLHIDAHLEECLQAQDTESMHSVLINMMHQIIQIVTEEDIFSDQINQTLLQYLDYSSNFPNMPLEILHESEKAEYKEYGLKYYNEYCLLFYLLNGEMTQESWQEHKKNVIESFKEAVQNEIQIAMDASEILTGNVNRKDVIVLFMDKIILFMRQCLQIFDNCFIENLTMANVKKAHLAWLNFTLQNGQYKKLVGQFIPIPECIMTDVKKITTINGVDYFKAVENAFSIGDLFNRHLFGYAKEPQGLPGFFEKVQSQLLQLKVTCDTLLGEFSREIENEIVSLKNGQLQFDESMDLTTLTAELEKSEKYLSEFSNKKLGTIFSANCALIKELLAATNLTRTDFHFIGIDNNLERAFNELF